MIQHSLNRKEKMMDVAFDFLEYLAVLVTPHPKESMQVIEKRRKDLEALRVKAGIIEKSSDEGKIFKKDHRNTTFYDEIRKQVGDATADMMLAETEGPDAESPSSVETYAPDFEDMEFIKKARAMQEEALAKKKHEASLNTVSY